MIEYTVKVWDEITKWYLDGKIHRGNNLPAIEYISSANGYKAWYVNGLRHRENGPAIEYADGSKGWYLKGLYYTEEEFNEKMNPKQDSCDGKMVEVDGKKYKLVEIY